MVEPVQGLRDSDEIGTRVDEAALLGRLDAVVDARVRFGVGDLRRTRIGRIDPREMRSERDTGLAVATTGIPREFARWGLHREPIEQRRGITRPCFVIDPGVT